MPDDTRDPLFCIRMDEEDRALLHAVAAHEKLTKSDVLRRGLREYAARAGVKVPKAKKK